MVFWLPTGRRWTPGFHSRGFKRENVRIVYQGVEGSYGHGAARRYFGPDADMYHVRAMEDAMTEVEEGRADYAVLLLKSSSAGAVSDNYDLLVKHNVYIAAETELPINHALLGREDADIKDIRTVYSHPDSDADLPVSECPQGLETDQHGQYGGSG